MFKAFRVSGLCFLTVLASISCSDPSPHDAAVSQPLKGDADASVPAGSPEFLRIKIPAESTQLFPNDSVTLADGDSYIVLTMDDYEQLLSHANRGNGGIQHVLSRILLNVQNEPSQTAIAERLTQDLCALAERGFSASTMACVARRLPLTSSEEDIGRVFELLRPVIADHSRDDIYSVVKESAEWKNASENPIAVQMSQVDKITDPMITCYSRDQGACEKKVLAIDEVLSQSPSVPVTRAALEELSGLFRNRSIRSNPVLRRADSLFLKAIRIMEEDDPQSARRYKWRKACWDDGDRFSCKASRAVPYGADFPADWSCEMSLNSWEKMLSGGQFDAFNSQFSVGAAECLVTGAGGSQDFLGARKILRWSFLSLPFYGADEPIAALGTSGIYPPQTNTALEQAYFARNVLGNDEEAEFAGFRLPTRSYLLQHIDSSKVPVLQEKSRQWNALAKMIGPENLTGPEGLRASQYGMLIAWLDYYDILNIDLLGSEGSAEDSQPRRGSQGTGFAVTDNGHLVTNFHVVDNCKAIVVGLEGQPADLLADDKTNDLALLKVDSRSIPLSIDVSRIQLGDEISALGFPLSSISGRQLTVTTGNVSALAGVQGDSRHFQFSAPIQPGSSGGAVIGRKGGVVGVVVATVSADAIHSATGATPQNMNYAIRASILKTFLDNHIDIQEGDSGADGMADAIAKASSSTYEVRCIQ